MHRMPLSASVSNCYKKNCTLFNSLKNGSNNDTKNDQDAVHVIRHTYVLVFLHTIIQLYMIQS